MNAYAHRFWHQSGHVQVDIYHDAVDIISPGWFISGQDPEDHLSGRNTSSETRNGLIAGTPFRSGDIESPGLKIRKIREPCDTAGVRVTYEEVPFGTKLTLHRNAPFMTNLEPDVRESAGKTSQRTSSPWPRRSRRWTLPPRPRSSWQSHEPRRGGVGVAAADCRRYDADDRV